MITGRHIVFYKSFLVLWDFFNCHIVASLEANVLKEVHITLSSQQHWSANMKVSKEAIVYYTCTWWTFITFLWLSFLHFFIFWLFHTFFILFFWKIQNLSERMFLHNRLFINNLVFIKWVYQKLLEQNYIATSTFLSNDNTYFNVLIQNIWFKAKITESTERQQTFF